MKRRQFTHFIALWAGSMAASAYAGGPVAFKSAWSDTESKYLSRDFFESQLGKFFTASGNEARNLRLKAVENACCHHQREQFHVIFEASPGALLEEGIYALESNNLSRMDLFLTRSDRGTMRQQMVATINLQTAA